MHDLYHRNQTTTTDMQQQSTDNKQNSNSIFPRVFLYSAIDAKDEVEEVSKKYFTISCKKMLLELS